MKIKIKNQNNVEKLLQVLVDEGYNFTVVKEMGKVAETIKIVVSYIIEVQDEQN